MAGQQKESDPLRLYRRRRSAVALGCVILIAAAIAWFSPLGSDHDGPLRLGARSASAAPASRKRGPVRLGHVCGKVSRLPRHYASVVVFAFENRTWSQVGMGFGRHMPYLHALARQCSYFTDWRNADPRPKGVVENVGHDSVAQYVAQVTGIDQPSVFNNCQPSPTCSTTANNIFRQARRAGLAAVDYVEHAPADCSAVHNQSTHVPGLYLWGGTDRFYCDSQVAPLSRFDPNHPPAFAFITPSLCDDGHDCPDSVVDRFARAHIQSVLQSRAYAKGKVAVFVWYDEDRPVPNLWIAPTARPGAQHLIGAGYAGTLRAWDSMLGLPCLANACNAPNMRSVAHA